MVDWHPLILFAQATSEDTPSWNEAISGHYPINKVEVVPSVWDFLVKRLADGSVRKFKASYS